MGVITVILQRRPSASGIIDRDTNRILSQSLRDTLQVVTPYRTGRLRRGWKISKVTNSQVVIENGVYYGVYVDQGTKHITPRRFTQRGIDRFWRSLDDLQKYFHKPDAEYVEP